MKINQKTDIIRLNCGKLITSYFEIRVNSKKLFTTSNRKSENGPVESGCENKICSATETGSLQATLVKVQYETKYRDIFIH